MSLVGMDDPAHWQSGIQRLKHAVKLDPDFASALAALATGRLRLITTQPLDDGEALRRAEFEAARAVQLRLDLASPHMAAASVAAARCEWLNAEEHFAAALRCEEDLPIVEPLHGGHLLLVVGHLSRALAVLGRAETRMHGMIGIVFIHAAAQALAGNRPEVRRLADLMLAMGARPQQPQIRVVFAWLARAEGRIDEAIELANANQPAHMIAPGVERVTADVMRALAGEDNPAPAVDALDRFLASLEPRQLPLSTRRFVLISYAELGALDRAHDFAHRSLDLFASQGTMFWTCLWDAEMRNFRSDARFAALASRLRFDEYWDRFGPPA